MAFLQAETSEKGHVWKRIKWRLHRPQVLALVGKSGTGKSFRAALIADKYDIDAIIDDGLLIAGGKILAGHSAKRESHYFAAVKTACFMNPAHRQEVRNALAERGFRRVLLLGTSDRMIEKNRETLGLPAPYKTIRIEDIATRKEIDAAIHDRSTRGRHVIPLPMIEVQRSYPRIIAESLTVWLSRRWSRFGRPRSVEKTVVRPAFWRKGEVTISEAVLGQMVLHCIAEQAADFKASRIRVKHHAGACDLKVQLAVTFDSELPHSLHHLHDYVVAEIERYTGICITNLSIAIEEVSESEGVPREPVSG